MRSSREGFEPVPVYWLQSEMGIATTPGNPLKPADLCMDLCTHEERGRLRLPSNVDWHRAARRPTVAQLAESIIAPAVHRARRRRTGQVARDTDHTASVTPARARLPEVEAACNNDGNRTVGRCAVAELTGAVVAPAIRVGKRRPVGGTVDRATSVKGARAHRREVESA